MMTLFVKKQALTLILLFLFNREVVKHSSDVIAALHQTLKKILKIYVTFVLGSRPNYTD